MSFLGLKIWDKASSNIKTAAATSSSRIVFKNKFLVNCKSEHFTDFFLLSLLLLLLFFFFSFLEVDFFYYISLRFGDPNGNKNRFRSFLGHPCHLRSRDIFSFSYASLLFNYFIMQSLIVAILFIYILNIFYDGEINTYIHAPFSFRTTCSRLAKTILLFSYPFKS